MILAFLAAIGRGVREFVVSLGFGTRTFFSVLGASGGLYMISVTLSLVKSCGVMKVASVMALHVPLS